MFVKTKDQVVVISGKDKGAKGKVVTVAPKTGKIVVEGVAMMTKHQKPRQQGQPGGIVKKEAFIDASNVMVICPKCGEKVYFDESVDPSDITCPSCGETFDCVCEDDCDCCDCDCDCDDDNCDCCDSESEDK